MVVNSDISLDSILTQIKAIIKKEDSLRQIGTEAALNEAEVCATMVQKLLTRHKVEMAQVMTHGEIEATDPVDQSYFDPFKAGVPIQRKRILWIENLAIHVSRAYFCRVLVSKTGGIWFVGRKQDRAVAMTMFAILNLEIRAALERPFRQAQRDGNGHGFITAFCLAAVDRIGDRYKEIANGLSAEAGTTAMVLASDAALDAWMKANATGSASSLKTNRWNSAGRRAGREFGDSVSLSVKPALEK